MKKIIKIVLLLITVSLFLFVYKSDTHAISGSDVPSTVVEDEDDEDEDRNLAYCVNGRIWTCIVEGYPSHPCNWSGSGCG